MRLIRPVAETSLLPPENTTITAIDGVRVGHATDARRFTGCTVLILETKNWPVVAAEVRGGLPGAYGTAGLSPTSTIRSAKALFLAGGSLDGFEVASGIRRYLMEKGKPLRPIFGVRVRPPVGISGAIVFDLGRRAGHAPTAQMGYAACARATARPVEEGNVGAGMGCTVGKLRGLRFSMKGGVGSSCVTLANGLTVGALVAANAVGNVVDSRTGQVLAGTRRPDGGFVEFTDVIADFTAPRKRRLREPPHGTTIGVVVTNAALQHDDVQKMVEMAHDGLARAIRPSHGATDGDVLFGVATADVKNVVPRAVEREWLGARRDVVGHLAADQVATAVGRAVRAAHTIPFPDAWEGKIPGLADL